MQKVTQAYFQAKATTTSQGEVIVILYNGAISFLNRAIEEMKARNFAQKGILISKALDVINELDSTLNYEKGGELAQNLHSLYFFCSTKLLKANLKMDVALVQQIIGILANLKSAFEEILSNPDAMVAAQETAMGQRAVSTRPLHATPIENTASPAIGTARASTLYARKNAEFAAQAVRENGNPLEQTPAISSHEATAPSQPSAVEKNSLTAADVSTPPLMSEAPPTSDADVMPQMRMQARNPYNKFAQS